MAAPQRTVDKFLPFLFINRMKTKHKTDKPERAEASDRLKAGQLLELTVVSLNDDGYGLATHEGKLVYVSGVLPGETVQVKVDFAGRREAFATVVRILRHNPQRLQTVPCDRKNNCDGCPLIQMKYPAQLAWKKGVVEQAIKRYQSLQQALVHEVAPSPQPLHYRNSAKLVVAGKFAAPQIGIYRRNSHDVLDLGDCPLHHPLINRVTAAVKEGIRKGKVSIYSPRSSQGLLRYLVVRVSETENRAMVVFVTSERNYNEIHHLAKYLQSVVPEVSVVVQNVNSSTGNVILSEKEFFLGKERALAATIGDIKFAISPRSFFQVNSGGARLIYEKVREWAGLTGKESVVDLYCGIGGISLFLARDAREVFGIEAVEAAVIDAEKNARLNQIRNCSFAAGDAADLLVELREEGKKVDLIVLNPPRKGCDERVLQDVAAIGPKKIIYVSCSPQTLARDLDILARLGYRTHAVQPVDMFPQTPHVEDVALLVK